MNVLQHMVREFMYCKRFGVVDGKMIEWDLEETSGYEIVDSME